MNKLDVLKNNHIEFLRFLKKQLPLYHKSNVFFRDLQYGVMEYFEKEKKTKVKYTDAEEIALSFAEYMENNEIFKKLDKQTWVLHYPDFTKKAS